MYKNVRIKSLVKYNPFFKVRIKERLLKELQMPGYTVPLYTYCNSDMWLPQFQDDGGPCMI